MIKLVALLAYNLLRAGWNKLRYGNRWKVHPLQRISPGCRIRLYDRGSIEIQRNTELERGCDVQVHASGKLVIGSGTYLNRYCIISAHQSVSIGSGCMFGPGVKIFDNNHRFSKEKGVQSELSTGAIRVGNRCWIAADAVLLKGASIGDGSVIGAGCVISGEVPAGSIVRLKQEQVVEPIH